MRVILSCLFSVFITFSHLQASAVAVENTRGPELVSISSDKSGYYKGDTATFQINLLTKPENPDYEFHIAAVLNNQSVDVDTISEDRAYSIVNFTNVGAQIYQVKIYLQNKELIKELYSSIDYLIEENCEIEKKIIKTVSKEKIEALQDIVKRNQALIVDAKAKINENRRSTGTAVSLTVTVQ